MARGPDRPFNQPKSLVGRLTFRFLGWLERRIVESSRVGVGPFFDPALFPWLDDVEASWERVLAELEQIMDRRHELPNFQQISEEVGYITADDGWKTFMLLGYGLRSERAMARCPETARLLGQIPGVKTAFFSILAPGKHIPEHRGPYNGVLRLHLALVVPEPAERCWIRVGDRVARWVPGRALIFDDAIRHEVRNETSGWRAVLFVDFVRPCRPPIDHLNRAVLALAAFSPLVRKAQRAQRAWEEQHDPDSAAL